MLVACFAVGHSPGDIKEDFLVFRGLSSESAAGCFALSSQERITLFVCLRSAQERLTLFVFWLALSSERCVCGFCQALDENRDEKVLSDILRRGNTPKRAGAYVSARKAIKLHNVNTIQYPRIPIYTKFPNLITYSSETLCSIEVSESLECTGTNHVFYKLRKPEG
jgi:hypothetical protein